MLPIETVQELVEKGIPGSEVLVQDTTGGLDHFRIHVTSATFDGKSLMDQHRMVFAALGEHLTTTIHAVDIQTEVKNV